MNAGSDGRVYGTLNGPPAGSTGSLEIRGANSYGTINFSDATNARTLTLPASTVTTILTGFNVYGGAGRLITVNSSTPGTPATLAMPNQHYRTDYLSLQDITVTGLGTYYAGSHSTNVSGNTGWLFADPPDSAVRGSVGVGGRVGSGKVAQSDIKGALRATGRADIIATHQTAISGRARAAGVAGVNTARLVAIHGCARAHGRVGASKIDYPTISGNRGALLEDTRPTLLGDTRPMLTDRA